MNVKKAWAVVKQTGSDWLDDRAMTMAASLAFYSVLSLAPMLVIAVAVAGFAFGEQAARGQIVTELEGLIGHEGGAAVEAVLASAHRPSAGIIGTVVGVVVLLFGASGVFGELQESLNVVWKVARKPGRGVVGLVTDRFFSFAMVLGVGFLALVSLVVTTLLGAMGTFFSHTLPGGEGLWQVLNTVISLVVTTGLFAMIFKFIPDAKVRWRDVWWGALVTAVLFTVGKLLIGLYLGKASVGSAYGAAGSLVVLVVWVYYSSQILLFGAELTQVISRSRGAKVEPTGNAVIVEPARAAIPAFATGA